MPKNINDDYNELVDTRESINVSIEDINSLNIIINDNDCNDSYIEKICQSLEALGIKFKFTRACEDINVPNSVVISLDQQYISGPKTAILTQYKNSSDNDSDALAIAMNSAFGECCNGIFCGRRGFQKNMLGNIGNRIPTSTESAIQDDLNINFVTICFGTDTLLPEEVTEYLKNGLGVFAAYRKVEDKVSDLIYRVEASDTAASISEKMGCSLDSVEKILNSKEKTQVDDAIINPSVALITAFNSPISINDNSNVERFTFIN